MIQIAAAARRSFMKKARFGDMTAFVSKMAASLLQKG